MKKFIIASVAILVLLVFFTFLLQSAFNKKRESTGGTPPAPTFSFEPQEKTGERETPSRRLTTQEKQKQLEEIAETNDDLLSKEQLENLNKLKTKLPFSSPDFDLRYSSELNQYVFSKKTPQADEKIKQFLRENNIFDLYEKGSEIILVTDLAIDQALEEAKNDLLNAEDDSETETPADETGKPGDQQEKDLKLFGSLLKTLLSFDLGEVTTPSPTAAVGQETGGAIVPVGEIVYPPNLGKPNSLGYYQMPEPQNGEYVVYSCSARRYGKKEMIGVLFTVALNYKAKFPASRLRIGDINAAGHKTHNHGTAVDINETIGGVKGPAANFKPDNVHLNPEHDEVARQRTIELGKLFLNTKLIRNIWYDDPSVTQALLAYAHANNIPVEGQIKPLFYDGAYHHGNHFHVDLFAGLRGSFYEPGCN